MFVNYAPPSYKLKGDDLDEITWKTLSGHLEPGDIMLRTYDHYLSSVLIPGYFKHGGIYAGEIQWDWAKLNSAWICDRPKHTVVHAIAEGVLIENCTNFFRTDHLVVLRPNIPKEKRLQAAHKALAHIGTKYDFLFESGDEAIYCTELVALAYEGLFNFNSSIQGWWPMQRSATVADDVFTTQNQEIIFHSSETEKFKIWEQRPR